MTDWIDALVRRARRSADPRRAGAASAHGSASGVPRNGPRRRCVWPCPDATPPIAPARRTSLARPRRPSVSRMCSALRGGHHGRSGCSASNVNATRRRAPSLTCRDLRCADVRAGGRPRSTASLHARSCAGRMDTVDASSRSCAPISIRFTPSGVSPPSTTAIAAAPSAASSPASPTSRSRVSGSVAMTMAARSGPASSSGPCRNCAVWSDSVGSPTASFSVSAPISAAARAGPRPRMTE